MSTTALERIRANLATLIDAAAAEIQAERDAEAAQAAAAIEAATSTAAVAAAYQQGRRDERRRVLALLETQRNYLARGGVNAISLQTMAQLVEDQP